MLSVASVTVIIALSVRLMLGDGSEFLAGMLVGVPLGALLGWLADQAIPIVVDRYIAAIRRDQ